MGYERRVKQSFDLSNWQNELAELEKPVGERGLVGKEFSFG